MSMQVILNDGGRKDAGYKGTTGDCVCRAIAIATGRPYKEIYDALAKGQGTQRGKGKKNTARAGISVTRKWFKDQMQRWGFEWTPTMLVGQGCKVHLAEGELPPGRLVVSLSKHYTCVIDGVIHDIYDCQRTTHHYQDNKLTHSTERCVYGYWKLKPRELQVYNHGKYLNTPVYVGADRAVAEAYAKQIGGTVDETVFIFDGREIRVEPLL